MYSVDGNEGDDGGLVGERDQRLLKRALVHAGNKAPQNCSPIVLLLLLPLLLLILLLLHYCATDPII